MIAKLGLSGFIPKQRHYCRVVLRIVSVVVKEFFHAFIHPNIFQ
jgi:hypothetical protein